MSGTSRHPGENTYLRNIDQPAAKLHPRAIGISSFQTSLGERIFVLFEDGTVWEHSTYGWTRLPPIPQGDA